MARKLPCAHTHDTRATCGLCGYVVLARTPDAAEAAADAHLVHVHAPDEAHNGRVLFTFTEAACGA